MVLHDAVHDDRRQVVFLGEFDALRDVVDDNPGGFERGKALVRIESLLLVFREEFRAHRLSHVVIERHGADEERVRADFVGDLFG